MKSLYESILDDEDDVMDRMTDEARIRLIDEYIKSDFFPWGSYKYGGLKNCHFKAGKDSTGFYIESRGTVYYKHPGNLDMVHGIVGDTPNSKYPKPCPEFRWKSHSGTIVMERLQNLEDIDGFPQDITKLFVSDSCSSKKTLNLGNRHIEQLVLVNMDDMKVGCTGSVNTLVCINSDKLRCVGFRPKKRTLD